MAQSRTSHPSIVTTYPHCAKAITPNDGADLTNTKSEPMPQTVFVGGGGVVAVVPAGLDDGTVVNFTVPAGGVVPVLVKRVMSTNTTATLLVGVY